MSQNRDAPAYQEYAATMLAQLPFRTMTLQDRGLFYTMRLECWVNKQLPKDKNDLAKVLGLPVNEVHTSLPVVMTFFAVKGDFIICPELESYREHLAERRFKQSQGGKKGSTITNRKRKRETHQSVEESATCSSATLSTHLPGTMSSTSSTDSQGPCQDSVESSVQTRKAKPRLNQLSSKRVIDDPFVMEYEAAEQCTAGDYARASKGY
ncbi:hypothetical protein SAMN05216326_1732 [Nitrosomonas marina]|uniref:Uncharacterized protein n=1 Tax=Nitrosomonas marina TaxID=917 RepID=A0A1I0GGL8_9PROT|nr:hypothetical protein [Nitrosomonas marina]SET70061.1 hypothetical protein SAMN05216326_1732 [Nitrosomonas marina]